MNQLPPANLPYFINFLNNSLRGSRGCEDSDSGHHKDVREKKILLLCHGGKDHFLPNLKGSYSVEGSAFCGGKG